MTNASDAAPCFRATSHVEGTLFVDIDVRGFIRPRAERARLRQAMAELSIELHDSPEVREVIAVIWTDCRPSAREMDLVTAAAEGVHCRAEMLRGTPLAMAVVFADDEVPVDRLRERLRLSAHCVPDGVSAMTWPEVRAHGVRACAAAYRL